MVEVIQLFAEWPFLFQSGIGRIFDIHMQKIRYMVIFAFLIIVLIFIGSEKYASA